MAQNRHLVSKREPIMMNGHVVGECFVGEYVDGPPKFGRCVAVDCPNQAAHETLTGMHFCDDHFSDFYSNKPMFQCNQWREWDTSAR